MYGPSVHSIPSNDSDVYRCIRAWFIFLNLCRLLLGIFGLVCLAFPSLWVYITGDMVPILCIILVFEVIGALVGLNSASLEKPHMFVTYEIIILILMGYYVIKTGQNIYAQKRFIETGLIAGSAVSCGIEYLLSEAIRKRLKRRQAKNPHGYHPGTGHSSIHPPIQALS